MRPRPERNQPPDADTIALWTFDGLSAGGVYRDISGRKPVPRQ